MKAEVLKLAMEGLKEAGIDLVSTLPSGGIAELVLAISRDRDFIHVPVANEEDAIAVACGASLGGKKPAVIMQNSGLILATYALLDSIYFFGGFPFLMVIDHKGDFHDDHGSWYFGYGVQVPRILDNFQVPYTLVRDVNSLKPELIAGQKAATTFGRAAAVLLSQEVTR